MVVFFICKFIYPNIVYIIVLTIMAAWQELWKIDRPLWSLSTAWRITRRLFEKRAQLAWYRRRINDFLSISLLWRFARRLSVCVRSRTNEKVKTFFFQTLTSRIGHVVGAPLVAHSLTLQQTPLLHFGQLMCFLEKELFAPFQASCDIKLMQR